ncbi:MAG: ribosomal protection-like ABC-F family protein [Christensenellaceae bacterium]|jgi:macrolide transport system ATP-binding/permease protein
MLLLQADKIKQEAGAELLFSAGRLSIHEGDRIGIIGRNGSGKTTLLDILAGERKPDEGEVCRHVPAAYLRQMAADKETGLSGGEQTKRHIQAALDENPLLLFLDEPDNHLDIHAIEYLKKQLLRFDGAVLIVSHNRELLDSVCTKIWEIEQGTIHIYDGNYEDYAYRKKLESDEQAFAYEQHIKEKKRLKQAMAGAQQRSGNVRKTPKRMGNSEARLHKMGGQTQKKKLDNAAKNIRSRIEQMGDVKRPVQQKEAKIILPGNLQIHNPVAVSSPCFSFSYGDKVVFDRARFSLDTNSKTALLGPNGSGKSTLMQMIYTRDAQFDFAANVKIGYLSQFYSAVDLSATILENIMRVSVHSEEYSRLILGRLRFTGQDVHKKCSVLSGGEINKVNLAMLMLDNVNLLLLDEPTNHMDMQSAIAVEGAIRDYSGTVLLVSHDRALLRNCATKWVEIRKKTLMEAEME